MKPSQEHESYGEEGDVIGFGGWLILLFPSARASVSMCHPISYLVSGESGPWALLRPVAVEFLDVIVFM